MDNGINRQKVIDTYNKIADQQKDENAVLDPNVNPSAHHKNVYRDYISKDFLIRHLRPVSDDVVVDFGCGVGRLSRFIAPKVKKVIGFDSSPGIIDAAKSTTDHSKFTNIQYHLFDGASFPLEDRFANKLFSVWVLNHLSELEILTMFSEAKRVLKPNGKIFLFELVKNDPEIIKEFYFFRNPSVYENLIRQAGLNLVSSKMVTRMPSYALGIWQRHTWLPRKLALPLLAQVEYATLNRKPQFINYWTHAFVIHV